MRLLISFMGLLVLTCSAFAQEPNNINVNCFFNGSPDQQDGGGLRCHAVANLHFQGGADDHLLVNCPGLGQNTIVYNNNAEFSANTEIVINPAGSETRPAVILPPTAFNCSQTPQTFESELVLPTRAPYFGARLEGSCQVVTAGCGTT